MEQIKRPWEGTTLAVLDILWVVFFFLAGLALLFLQQAIPSLLKVAGGSSELIQEEVTKELSSRGVDVSQVDIEKVNQLTEGAVGILSSFGLVIGIILIGIGIFMILMARGALKGHKWSPVISLIFAAIGLLGALTSLSQGGNAVLAIAINGLIVYCAIMCLKHPYFDKNKRLPEQTPPAAAVHS